MKHSITFKTTLTIAAVTGALAFMPGPASAQLYVNRSSTYAPQPAYTTRAYSNPYTSGYGNNYRYNNSSYYNRGYYNSPYLYMSPGSFDKKDDPYHRRDRKSNLQRSKERFRDLRYDSRTQNNYYNNETYKQNNPYDSRYYERNIR